MDDFKLDGTNLDDFTGEWFISEDGELLPDMEIEEDTPSEKAKRKAKRGDKQLTDFGNAIIGVVLSICVGIILTVGTTTLPKGLLSDVLCVYWLTQCIITLLVGLIYCLEASDPSYAMVTDNFESWRRIFVFSVLWPYTGVYICWTWLAPHMYKAMVEEE